MVWSGASFSPKDGVILRVLLGNNKNILKQYTAITEKKLDGKGCELEQKIHSDRESRENSVQC